jgi:hypothetical protein
MYSVTTFDVVAKASVSSSYSSLKRVPPTTKGGWIEETEARERDPFTGGKLSAISPIC